MSRRTKLSGIFQQSVDELAMANFQEDERAREPAGPVKSMALTLGRMEDETRALQEALKAGQHVQELDPKSIDVSFVRDRLEDAEFDDDHPLVQSFKENGQKIPILVRPHPDANSSYSYQVAFGHRRLKAASFLEIKVLAIVRDFDDEGLVLAQGVENSERQNLSYIERAVFAFRLEERGFSRHVIGKALSTDKTELSKLIAVSSSIPLDVIQAIGSAPGVGRRRWLEFSSVFKPDRQQALNRLFLSPGFSKLSSDDRFQKALLTISQTEPRVSQDVREWKPTASDGLVGTIKATDKAFSLTLRSNEAAQFGNFLSAKLDELFQEYELSKETK